jgi:hypothetical protein
MGGKLMAFSILGSTALLEHWSIEKAKLRVLECGLQDFSFVFDFVLAVFNPKSELRNLKSEGGGEHGAGSCSKRSSR